MTFSTTAWAIDGALLGSSLARQAEFAAVGGAEGTVRKADLKVRQLTVPGVGVLIDAGGGLVTNNYQANPNETYVVSNPGSHTIPAVEMPAASPSARSYILAIVVGDKDFSQTGHPWMAASDPPAGTEQSFNYVRPTLIQVAAGAKKLDVPYPALVLARIDIPANTTTILNSHITDLRKLARPRQAQEAFVSPGGTWNNASPRNIPSGSAHADWGPQEFLPTVTVPTWATRAILIVSINSIRYKDTSSNIKGNIRTQLGAVAGPQTIFDFEVEAGGGVRRTNLQTAGEYDVSGIAGTSVGLRVEGYQNSPASPTADQKLRLQGGSQIIYDVRFFEE